MHPSFKKALDWELEAQLQIQQAQPTTPVVELLDSGQATGLFESVYFANNGRVKLTTIGDADPSLVTLGDKVFLINRNGSVWLNTANSVAIGTIEAVTNTTVEIKGIRTNNCSPTAILCKQAPHMTGGRDSLKVRDNNWPSLSFTPPISFPRENIPGKYLSRYDESAIQAFCRAVAGNDVTIIKGPPGGGKSDLTGYAAVFKAFEQRKRVLVTAKSHQAVNEVLHDAHVAAQALGINIPILRVVSKRAAVEYATTALSRVVPIWTADKKIDTRPVACIIGAVVDSAYYFPDWCSFDTVFWDEAGQWPMFSVACLGGITPSFVFIGDEDQLPPIHSAEHVNNHSPAKDKTIAVPDPAASPLIWFPKHRGPEWVLQLAKSQRLNKQNCALISKHYYAGKLSPAFNADSHVVGLPGTVFKIQSGSPNSLVENEEEANTIVDLIKQLLGKPVVLDRKPARPITVDDFAVLTPYNKQAKLLKKKLINAGLLVSKVGTVDIMQGQSRAIVIFGVTTTDPKTLAERAEWHLISNRWNVGLSRSKSSAFLIGRFDMLKAARPTTWRGQQYAQKVLDLIAEIPDLPPNTL